jgi:dienelactone hydrolase
MPCIQAYVWEYQTPVSLAPDTAVDDLLHIAARAAFLEHTHADQFLCDEMQLDSMARVVGRTWYGLLVQDGSRAIDYLLARPAVDPARIGATGLGAGGAVTMYLAALDDRVQAAAIYQYLDRYLPSSLDEEWCPCNDIPGILRHAEMGDVAALIAPRPVLFVNGRNDAGTNAGVRESFATVRHMYHFVDAPRKARLVEPEGDGNCFDNPLAIGWFRRWLARAEGVQSPLLYARRPRGPGDSLAARTLDDNPSPTIAWQLVGEPQVGGGGGGRPPRPGGGGGGAAGSRQTSQISCGFSPLLA